MGGSAPLSDRREALQRRLGHVFNDPSLLDDALTHRSARSRHNERLEFLGDALLNFVIADALYRRYPGSAEGELSRMRAALVRAEALAELAHDLQLGELLVLGAGEVKSGGRRRGSTLGDALEALIGATWLDAGFDVARAAVLALYDTRLSVSIDRDLLKDAKTRLQEFLQARGLTLPAYTLVEESGEPHRPSFRVACGLDTPPLYAEGEGRSRRAAEQAAAAAMLDQLEDAGG